jgi:uracil-DNA glycosylase
VLFRSAGFLFELLTKLGIINDCYFTNIVKGEIEGEPTEKDIAFWYPYFQEELAILKPFNPDMKIVCLGQLTEAVVKEENTITIPHPNHVLNGGMTLSDYENTIQTWLKNEQSS